MYIQFKKVIKGLPDFTLQKAQTIPYWAQLYTILDHLGLVWIRKTNPMHRLQRDDSSDIWHENKLSRRLLVARWSGLWAMQS